jgi:N-acetylglucosamine-6-phosphate deacetylase
MKLLAAHYQTGELVEFTLDEGHASGRRARRGPTDLVFGPGFVDLQCNGFAGVDFNRRETEPIVIASAVRAMWEHGCTEVLPTFITAAPDALDEFISDFVKALACDAEAARSVPGFHLEGPFISPQDGARGAHPAKDVRPVSEKLWRQLQKVAEGRIRLVTLAPEVRGALPFIRKLREEKVAVALGHTMADAATVAAAAEAGASLSTHLGNGCPELIHRHQNPIFAQLGEDRLAASFIADGLHLPAEVLRGLWRAKGPGRALLVSDAMAAAAAPPGRYSIGDLELEVGADGVVREPGKKHFAGSTLTMENAVANLVRFAGVSLAEAWTAASVQPWEVLRRAGAVKKRPESCVVARWSEGRLEVQAAFRGTRVLFAKR